MGYLVAKIVVLLLLAAACGFWLAHWWLRRRYQDVTEEYTRLVDASSAGATVGLEGLKRIEDRLATVDGSIQGLGLEDVEARLRTAFGERLAALERTVLQQLPKPTDLGPVSQRLEALEKRVSAVRTPDLGPIEARLGGLAPIGDRLSAIERQLGSAAPKLADFSPVTKGLEALAAAVGDRLSSLERQMASLAPRPVDLGPIEARLGGLATLADRLASLELSVGSLAAGSPDLGPLTQKLEAVERAVAGSRAPDLGPLEARLGALGGIGERLGRMEQSIASLAPASTDLAPVNQRIEALAGAMGDRLSSLERQIDALALRPVDLGPVMQRLEGVERAVARFSSPDLGPIEARLGTLGIIGERLQALEQRASSPTARPVDLAPVEARLAAILDRLGAFGPGGEGQVAPDLGLVYVRMDGLERQIEALRGLLERAVERPAPTVVLAGSRNLLRRPVYGPPDDLKRIRGIGTALEKLLQRLGVYYFWQVAEWDHNDVKFVDGHLEIFKGRIDRDQWVEQARALTGETGSARRPDSLEAPPAFAGH